MRVLTLLLPLSLGANVGAFSASSHQQSFHRSKVSTTPLSAFEDPGEVSAVGPSNPAKEPTATPVRRGPVMSDSLPFLKCPAVLADCEFAGNVGFDPLGFAKNTEQLMEYREAEMKHARLAMLVRLLRE